MKRILRQTIGAGAALIIPLLAAGAQASGTITGRITDKATQQPIGDAQVLIVGTTRGARSTDNGQYRLVGVPTGSVRIRVIRLGYEAETRSLTISANETVTADFALGATATRLDQVVVSATGESEIRRESGNNVATINTDSIPKTVVNGVSDLLSSRGDADEWDDRRRVAHSHSRVEQSVPVERAAHHHRWRPRDQRCVRLHDRHRRTESESTR
jgi:hypothetical protein